MDDRPRGQPTGAFGLILRSRSYAVGRMRRAAAPLPVMLLAVAALVGAVAIPVALLRDDGAAPTPSPATGAARVSVSAGEVRTIPQLSPADKNALIGALSGALRELYERAFLSGPFDPEPEQTPAPLTPVDDLFTDAARTALRKDPGVFRVTEPLEVGDATVTFAGAVTLQDGTPAHALLEVEFLADATSRLDARQVVRLRQVGSLLLVSRPAGWRVASFDLAFSTRPQPTPR